MTFFISLIILVIYLQNSFLKDAINIARDGQTVGKDKPAFFSKSFIVGPNF